MIQKSWKTALLGFLPAAPGRDYFRRTPSGRCGRQPPKEARLLVRTPYVQLAMSRGNPMIGFEAATRSGSLEGSERDPKMQYVCCISCVSIPVDPSRLT